MHQANLDSLLLLLFFFIFANDKSVFPFSGHHPFFKTINRTLYARFCYIYIYYIEYICKCIANKKIRINAHWIEDDYFDDHKHWSFRKCLFYFFKVYDNTREYSAIFYIFYQRFDFFQNNFKLLTIFVLKFKSMCANIIWSQANYTSSMSPAAADWQQLLDTRTRILNLIFLHILYNNTGYYSNNSSCILKSAVDWFMLDCNRFFDFPRSLNPIESYPSGLLPPKTEFNVFQLPRGGGQNQILLLTRHNGWV